MSSHIISQISLLCLKFAWHHILSKLENYLMWIEFISTKESNNVFIFLHDCCNDQELQKCNERNSMAPMIENLWKLEKWVSCTFWLSKQYARDSHVFHSLKGYRGTSYPKMWPLLLNGQEISPQVKIPSNTLCTHECWHTLSVSDKSTNTSLQEDKNCYLKRKV